MKLGYFFPQIHPCQFRGGNSFSRSKLSATSECPISCWDPKQCHQDLGTIQRKFRGGAVGREKPKTLHARCLTSGPRQ